MHNYLKSQYKSTDEIRYVELDSSLCSSLSEVVSEASCTVKGVNILFYVLPSILNCHET